MPFGATRWAARASTLWFSLGRGFSGRWASGVLALLCAGRAWIGVTGLKRGQRGSEVVKGRWMVHVGPPQGRKKALRRSAPWFPPFGRTIHRVQAAKCSVFIAAGCCPGCRLYPHAAPRSTACAAFPGAQRTSFGRSSYDSWDTSVGGRLCPRSSCFPRGTCLSQLGQERDSVP